MKVIFFCWTDSIYRPRNAGTGVMSTDVVVNTANSTGSGPARWQRGGRGGVAVGGCGHGHLLRGAARLAGACARRPHGRGRLELPLRGAERAAVLLRL